WSRIDTFFFGRRSRSSRFVRCLGLAMSSLSLEGFFVGVHAAAATATGGRARRCRLAATAHAATALVLGDRARGPPQGGADVVRDDLDDAALLAVLGLPRALLETTGDHDARALADRFGDVLGHLAPAHDVEEAALLLPLLRLAVLPAAAHRDAERRLRRAAWRVPHLGITGDVAHDRDVAVGHLG